MTSHHLATPGTSCPTCSGAACAGKQRESGTDDPANLADLVMGWEELSGGSGARGYTVAQAIDALAGDAGAERFESLRLSLGKLCPHRNGQLPTPRELGCALRRAHGRIIEGRRLASRVRRGYRLWFVEHTGTRASGEHRLPQICADVPHPMSRPSVQVNGRQLIAIIEDAWRAVHAANDPAFLFRRDGRLVRRICAGGRAHVVSIDATELYGLLVRVADWVKATPSGLVPARPPRAVAADMRRFPDVSLPTP